MIDVHNISMHNLYPVEKIPLFFPPFSMRTSLRYTIFSNPWKIPFPRESSENNTSPLFRAIVPFFFPTIICTYIESSVASVAFRLIRNEINRRSGLRRKKIAVFPWNWSSKKYRGIKLARWNFSMRNFIGAWWIVNLILFENFALDCRVLD